LRIPSSTLIALFFLLPLGITGQELLPINQEIHLQLDRALTLSNSEAHTSFRPLLYHNIKKYVNPDSLLIPGSKAFSKERSLLVRKALSENLIFVDSSDFKISIDPLLDFSIGREKEGTSIYNNSRGININAQIGKNLWVNSSFLETQGRYPTYIDDFITKYGVAPGQTIVKEFSETDYDYGVAYGLISYTPFKFLNIQAGQGKNFIGDGYRSLFLSDNSFQYPYTKLTANWNKLQMVSVTAMLQNINTKGIIWAPRPWESPFIKKPASFNYLTYNVSPKLQLGVFEGVVFRSPWGTALTWKFFNPVIFTRTIRYELNGENNVILGFNGRYTPMKKLMFYGQLVIDDFKMSGLGKGHFRNRTGFQAGFKLFEPFGLKNLVILQEYNQVRPYTYSHEFTRQTYTAYNQALAHPLGANFKEYISIIDYRYKRWHVHTKFMLAAYGSDLKNADWGQNIFLSTIYAYQAEDFEGNFVGQGRNTTLTHILIKGAYTVNPKTNLNINFGYYGRKKTHLYVPSMISSCYFIGISTNLFNQYTDF